jgi:DNA-binding beta-propeller fold protein YncE
VNSVAVGQGVIAVAMQNAVKTDPGQVVFFDLQLQILHAVPVGALPDLVTLSPDGRWVLVANEGEPNSYGLADSVDPEGSITIIDLATGVMTPTVRTATFTAFNGAALDPTIRIFGPNATVAQDLEPEGIAVSPDSGTAYVTLQENNALGVVDIESATVTQLIGLGFKDHNLPGNGLDASNLDNMVNIANWPVLGLYLPDEVAAIAYQGNTYLVMANEGDARDYPGLKEEVRCGSASVVLDPVRFPNAAQLKKNANLGRLNVSNVHADADGDGDYDALYSFGARSFSIRDAAGQIVFDSGDQLEQLTAALFPLNFNCNNTASARDSRSDDKGPEPEGVALGKVAGRLLAFVGLERIGGVVVYDVSNPFAVELVDYVNTRTFDEPPAGDLGPEGLQFISADDSPTGRPLLAVAHEISGSVTLFEITKRNRRVEP